MKEGFFLLLGAGIILFVFTAVKDLRQKGAGKLLSAAFDPALLIMIAGTFAIRILVKNEGISHPDDMSHWYRLCKVLFFDDSFPVTDEITYLTYPPGTAVFIYIFTRSFGFNIANCFTAQALIGLSACSFYGASFKGRKKKSSRGLSFLIIPLAAAMFFLLSEVSVGIITLTVDGILGMVAAAAVFYIQSLKGRCGKADLVILTMLISFICLIKFSGYLFLALILLFYIKDQRGNSICALKIAPVPVLLPLLYNLRNSILIGSFGSSDQAFTAARLLGLFSGKPADLIVRTLLFAMGQALPVIGAGFPINVAWIGLCGLLALYLLGKRRGRNKGAGKNMSKDISDEQRRVFFFCLQAYMIYLLFLILTYLFSMDNTEAFILSCYNRYMGTVAIFIFAIFVSRVLLAAENLKNGAYIGSFAAILIAVILMALFLPQKSLDDINGRFCEGYTDRAWNALSNAEDERYDHTDESFLIVWDQEVISGSNYKDFQLDDLAQTFLRSMNVDHMIIGDAGDLSLISNYDHVIVARDF